MNSGGSLVDSFSMPDGPRERQFNPQDFIFPIKFQNFRLLFSPTQCTVYSHNGHFSASPKPDSGPKSPRGV